VTDDDLLLLGVKEGLQGLFSNLLRKEACQVVSTLTSQVVRPAVILFGLGKRSPALVTG
jgi:hypothetical protein